MSSSSKKRITQWKFSNFMRTTSLVLEPIFELIIHKHHIILIQLSFEYNPLGMSRDSSSTESTLISRRPSRSLSCLSGDADVILTRRQQKLIFEVWDSIPNHSIFWQSVYIQLFMHKPSLKLIVEEMF
uniref:Uncharacterized protein n=1 Tax=Romanomermis culicivorax TaxID=13658 RepID=A0A915IXB5_ROMCU